MKIVDVLGPELSGRLRGKEHVAMLASRARGEKPGSTLILDFHGVRNVTGSWLSAALVPFFRLMATKEYDLFPIIANVDQNWIDEFALVGEWNDQIFIVGTLANGVLWDAKLVGSTDQVQYDTFSAVMQYGDATGADLSRTDSGRSTQPTTWNNRLKDLHEKRLLRRRSLGRKQVYTPVIKEISIDGR